MSNQWIIFDIDGTLADIGHRLHHIKGEKKDWYGFNSRMKDDGLKFDIYMLYEMCKSRYKIAIVTGRFEEYREVTTDWLMRNGIYWDELHMRPSEDYRSDDIIKQDILKKHFQDNSRQIRFVVDDRDRVVNMWRHHNITCLQCQKGEY